MMMRSILASLVCLLVGGSAFAQESEGTVTYDVGLSSGRVEQEGQPDKSYLEPSIGFSYHFMEHLAWRNSIFGRFGDVDTAYGIDTSMRAQGLLGDHSMGVSGFLGPGFRFITKGDNVPFLEGGVILHAAGISLGAGVKTFFNSVVRSGAENENQLLIIFGGGGVF